MELGIKDRLSIIQMLPQSSSLTDMVDILDIIKKVRIEKEEADKIHYQEYDGRISWDSRCEEPKEVQFTFEQVKILKSAVAVLDAEKKVNPSNLDICLKINNL